MFPVDDDCDACTAPLYDRSIKSSPAITIIVSSIPFLFTFCIVSTLVLYKLFPYLADREHLKTEHYLPSSAPPSLRASHSNHGQRNLRRQVAAVAFATTIGLSTVLMELILCEISNTLNPAARTLALKITVSTLLFLLIILIPFLELQSVVRSVGGQFGRSADGKTKRFPWVLQIVGFLAWLTLFWWLGQALPGTHVRNKKSMQNVKSLSNACLERIGVIGICLMALLSGFAATSSPWQCFGAQPRPVTESDLSRKEAGLDATNDMLGAKRSRLRALQHKINSTPKKEGFVKMAMSSIRGDSDAQELKMLRLEIAGLETMSTSLSSGLSLLQTRFNASLRASTPLGKAMIVPNYLFSVYCIYRIFMTIFTTLRRFTSPQTVTFSNTDPINRFLSLISTHYDPTLDQAAWSRQISFLLSGIILLLSFNSVLQTFYLMTRWTPGLLSMARQNAALIVGQIAATYVISSALLLRSNLPKEVGSVISEALGTPLDSWFVDRWFEGWFLCGVVCTATGIWMGRKFGNADGGMGGDEWDDMGDMEMGHKRS